MNIENLESLLDGIKARKSCLVISVLSLKGGAGKTTVSTNLAWSLKLLGLDVLLVDSDHPDQLSASLWAENSEEDKKVSCVQISDRSAIKSEIPRFKQLYDVIVVDGRPNDNLIAAACVRVSDLIIVPLQPTALEVWRVRDLVDIIEQRQELDDSLKSAILLNMTKKNSNSDKRAREGIKELFDINILKSQLTNLDAYQDDIGIGRGVLSRPKDNNASNEMKCLLKEIGRVLND